MKKSTNIVYCVVLPLILFGLAAYVLFGMCLPEIQNKDIFENGNEGTATVDKVYYSQSSGICYFEFTFKNDSGEDVTRQTSDVYSAEDLLEMGIFEKTPDNFYEPIAGEKTIEIMYLGNNAVPKNYIAKNDISVTMAVSICIAVLGVGLFVTFFILIKKSERLGSGGAKGKQN